MFEVRVDRRLAVEGALVMAERQQGYNDHDRRKAAIVRLAAKIGMTLCQAGYRHLGEHEWARLDRMRLQLGALRVEAGL
jgi:hypothetical protein